MTEARVSVETITANAFVAIAEEEAHRDHQASEALLLTYNTDLGFFESRLLGAIRACGAAITVVGDANVWSPDLRAVRFAGRSYHFGMCTTAAAFHPKLLVLAGPRRAVVAVGSGNLTMGGWQYNSELLTVFRGTDQAAPTGMADLRHALAALVGDPGLDDIVRQGIHRTEKMLSQLLASAEQINTGHRVFASWQQPLITRLPTDPVAELCLSSAFFDPHAKAVRDIVDRLQPKIVRVSVQPGWTHLDPGALTEVLDAYATRHDAKYELLEDPLSHGYDHARYRHGKLIEWTTFDGRRHALAGSANLSRRGLLRGPNDGGNHELVVVGPTAERLFPGGRKIQTDSIPVLVGPEREPDRDPDETAPPVFVTAAARAQDGVNVVVHLNRAAPRSLRVEVSHRQASPDDWAVLGVVHQGTITAKMEAPDAPPGSRLRVSWSDEGHPRHSPAVYLTDPSMVLQRSAPTSKVSRAHAATAQDLFGFDVALLDSLLGDLAAFAHDTVLAKGPPVTRPAAAARASTGGRDEDVAEPWLWMQEATLQGLGPGVASWLLGLPHLAAAPTGDARVPWLDKINDDDEVGLHDEDPEAAAEEVANTIDSKRGAEVHDHLADAEHLRRSRRRWVSRAVAAAPDFSVASQLVVLRLALAFWSAENWDEDDDEPFGLVVALLRMLATQEPLPPEMDERIGAASSIAVTMLKQRTDPRSTNHRSLRLRDAAAEAKRLVAEPPPEDVLEQFLLGLRTPYGGTLQAGHVRDALDGLVFGDPLRPLQLHLESEGLEVTRPAANQIAVRGSYSNPEPVCLDAVGMSEDATGIAVWALNGRGDWAVAAWSAPDLVTVIKARTGGTRWRHQRLTNRMQPAAIAAAYKTSGPGQLPNIVSPRNRESAAAREVLDRLGVDLERPPGSHPTPQE